MKTCCELINCKWYLKKDLDHCNNNILLNTINNRYKSVIIDNSCFDEELINKHKSSNKDFYPKVNLETCPNYRKRGKYTKTILLFL